MEANLDFAGREKDIAQFWKENNIARLAVNNREGAETFTFYDGPPTANGKPHIGHVLTRAIKDMFPRYQSMKGKKVIRKAGWDTQGLPVELEVEKEIGISGKEEIENYGIELFIEKCRSSVWQYKEMWEEFSTAVGYWADMDNPYITYENTFIESEWWALKEIWSKGLLYKGHKIVPYCPRCGTPLSSHEVAQGYKNITEPTAIVKFKALDEDAYFLAWTTTPWTLPSNLALCVNPEIDYVKLKLENNIYYLAKALISSVFEEKSTAIEILASFKGKHLEYRKYEPLYPFAAKEIAEKSYFITCDDYVTTEDGTGIVHIAPAFGEDDNRVCKKYNIPFVQFVNARGELTAETYWDGMFVKDADKLILENLAENNKLLKSPIVEHNYPHCWRCDTPLIYYARAAWFIKMTAVRDRLLANNDTVNWIPKTIGSGRFGNWLSNVQDWGISRERYWGTPLPIWECSCGHRQAVGSIAELRELAPACPEDIELHRPYIDSITFPCAKCGNIMSRVEEVIDCWFDSGAMPFAQWHYPFENEEIFNNSFPADFISEAVDQTRGWFYSLIAISTVLFDKSSFDNVIVLGHVLDENGQKMSKSKGNAVDPMEALRKHGADAIRWYFYENSAPWLPNRFHDAAVKEGQSKFMGTLWNTYAFFVLYANIDQFNPLQYNLDYEKLNIMDKWLLSRLNTMVKIVDSSMSTYNIPDTAKALKSFVEELSNWYVRRSRSRFWAKGMEQDKINAYLTLWTALVTTSKAAAPLIPFMTESIYCNLVANIDADAPISVHLTDYPVANTLYIDTELEQNMQLVLDIIMMARAARNEANIKNRQPIGIMYYTSKIELPSYFQEIMENELNIKDVVYQEDMTDFIAYEYKPNFPVLGPKIGKHMGAVKKYLSELGGNEAKLILETAGKLEVNLDGNVISLEPNDVEVNMVGATGYNCKQYGDVSIAINTELNAELIEEGFVREIISKIQNMRKALGLEVTARIKLSFADNELLLEIISKNEDVIKDITLADNINYNIGSVNYKEWNINGERLHIGIII